MTTLQLSKLVNKSARLSQQSLNQVLEDKKHAIEINYRLPYVAIMHADGSEYFFQDEEADNLIEEARRSPLHDYCSIENIILWQSIGW
jgi:hypothetical protein